MKRTVIFVLSLAIILSSVATVFAASGMANFKSGKSYTQGQFADVAASAWYASGVKAAYELGLVNGTSGTTFNPDGDISMAEAIAIACRIHSIYNGNNHSFTPDKYDSWYSPYEDYAHSNGILPIDVHARPDVECNRNQFANYISKALPAEEYKAINNITSIPDVGESYASDKYYINPDVYMLYRAGILTGSDKYGTFNPYRFIKRSEIATIITRIAIPSQRKTFTLEYHPGIYTEPEADVTKNPYPAG